MQLATLSPTPSSAFSLLVTTRWDGSRTSDSRSRLPDRNASAAHGSSTPCRG